MDFPSVSVMYVSTKANKICEDENLQNVHLYLKSHTFSPVRVVHKLEEPVREKYTIELGLHNWF